MIFRGSHLFLIAGPCVLEDDEFNVKIATDIAAIARGVGIETIFKASFDKANRRSGSSPRGPGLNHGIEMLRRVKGATGLPTLTDIHRPEQAALVSGVADVLQIPALLSRQTDLITAAAMTGRAVNIKKGQSMSMRDMAGAVEKVRDVSLKIPVAVTERGTFFGYGDLVVDLRNIARQQEPGHKGACSMIFDVTHSVQMPGAGAGFVAGGQPSMIEPLALAAVAAGCDGLFIETHHKPSRAPSDGASMLPLDRLARLLEKALRVREAVT